MTSSAHDADIKGNNFRRTRHPQSFIAVAFVLSELDRGAYGAPHWSRRSQKKPGLDRVQDQSPYCCVLCEVTRLAIDLGYGACMERQA